MRPTWLLLLAGITLPATPLAAQRLEPRPFTSSASSFGGQVPPTLWVATDFRPAAHPAGGNVAGMILGGVAIGAAGLFGGALVGDRFQSYPCEDCIEGAFYGALAGESLAIPLGVHLADHRRGKLGPALAASIGIGAVG
ncbi:MAG TPA: hypothetical protein VFP28_02420, partial [Gemmatimonadales bacterium]|nr:hypothetical protein [Gemmatimonadales bacterium]